MNIDGINAIATIIGYRYFENKLKVDNRVLRCTSKQKQNQKELRIKTRNNKMTWRNNDYIN